MVRSLTLLLLSLATASAQITVQAVEQPPVKGVKKVVEWSVYLTNHGEESAYVSGSAVRVALGEVGPLSIENVIDAYVRGDRRSLGGILLQGATYVAWGVSLAKGSNLIKLGENQKIVSGVLSGLGPAASGVSGYLSENRDKITAPPRLCDGIISVAAGDTAECTVIAQRGGEMLTTQVRALNTKAIPERATPEQPSESIEHGAEPFQEVNPPIVVPAAVDRDSSAWRASYHANRAEQERAESMMAEAR